VYKHGYHLTTDADFDNAIYFGFIVSVTHDGEHLGSGHLVAHSKNVVRMVNSEFFKYNSTFTVCLHTKV
jgi:hypothetical protein